MSVAEQSLTDRISYDDLYRRWEEGNWSATAIDLSRDRAGWEALSEIQRRSALWTYSMFLYGEDSVADNLSPYIDAAPTEEQKYFLATQQVDEARHAVFFHRFFNEVIGVGGPQGAIAATLASTAPELNWGYRKVFGRLDRMADELRRDRSLPKFAQAITLYHLVVEATLAQPGQHFIEDFFTRTGAMPGFSEGMANVSRDEQRHIGFGVKLLSELVRTSDEIEDAIAELLREVLPWALAVYVPPGWDRRYTREYGFELEEIYAFAIRSLKTKFTAIGCPLEEMAGVLPLDPGRGEDELAARLLEMLEAGLIGEPNGRPDSSRRSQELFFELVANSVDRDAASRPLTVAWEFLDDADPWTLTVANGSTRAEPGLPASPDLRLRMSWADVSLLATGELDPARAIATRRLRFRGSPLALLRFQRLMPRIQGSRLSQLGTRLPLRT